MVIVNQDKRSIYNFENINCLIISEHSLSDITDKKAYNILCFDNTYRSSDTSGDKLGTYKTEERAKKVLEEIVYVYEHMKYLQTFQNHLMEFDEKPNFVYEMPED